MSEDEIPQMRYGLKVALVAIPVAAIASLSLVALKWSPTIGLLERTAESRSVDKGKAAALEQGKAPALEQSKAALEQSKAASEKDKAALQKSNADLAKGKAAYESRDYATALQVLRPLADRGNAAAQAILGGMYSNGQGVPRNATEGVRWYSRAANQGDAGAQEKLGVMYMFGDGIKQDDAEAVKWFRKAADQGSAGGQNNLAAMYMTGRGVKEDYVQAYKWSKLASAASQASQVDIAVQNLAAIVKRLTPAQIADAQDLVREWRPVSNDEASLASAILPRGLRTPFWRQEDIEADRIKAADIVISSVTQNDKPPFYHERMPLQLKIGYPPVGSEGNPDTPPPASKTTSTSFHPYYRDRQLFYIFPEFGTMFVYRYKSQSSPSPIIGAQTRTRDGRIVAEARIRPIDNIEPRFEAEEVHYGDDGTVIFYCKSEVDLRGYKTREIEARGKKTKEFYFMWPDVEHLR